MSEATSLRLSWPGVSGQAAWAFLASAVLNLLFVWGLSVSIAPRDRALISGPLAVDLITAPLSRPSPALARPASVVSSPSGVSGAGARGKADPALSDAGGQVDSLTEFVTPGPTGIVGEVPAGLRSLLSVDPCEDTLERLKKDCRLRWAGAMAPGGGVSAEILEELAEAFPGIKPDGVFCSLHLGCGAAAQILNLNGTRPVDRVSPMASGPGGLGGPHDLVGRLPPPNPYHVDPGFGD